MLNPSHQECTCSRVGTGGGSFQFTFDVHSPLLLQVNDECALSQSVKEEMYKCYPDAKRAHLKDGGNFPYLSRSDEVNIHIQVFELCVMVNVNVMG